jgi:hypothetical protein
MNIAIDDLATSLGMTEDELLQQAVKSFLREKRRQIVETRLGILARYGADSLTDLEAKIANGSIAEHPGWEDLITVENLSARLEELDAHLSNL